jgi:glutamate-ammonia-ligase adenylyltransferase
VSARKPPASAAARTLKIVGFHNPPAAWQAIGRLYNDDDERRHLVPVFPSLMRLCGSSSDADRALVNFERLAASLPNRAMFYQYLREAPDRLEILVRLFAHSQAMADTLTRNASNLHFLIAPATMESPRSRPWMDAELRRLLMVTRLPREAYNIIRRFRRREMLRIGTRDLMGRATVEQTTMELSNLADVCIQAVFETAVNDLAGQYKLKADARAAAGRFAVIGMGKLGGQELNYSSDIDVIFVYGEEGQLTPQLTRHEFFTKLAEIIIEAVGSATDEGTIFRIDLRLRPEGRTGPLVSSLDACENYYAGYGETWERMALVKARPIAGDMEIGNAFLQMVQPFVYRRYTGQRIIQQMAELKKRIETEIVHEDRLTRHVKLGIGGIREIEFIVQSFQVLRGARSVVLRERNSLRALSLLSRAGILTPDDASQLADAYRFLRNVEHRLQMEMELQTHIIPDEERAQERLAHSLGFKSIAAFAKAQNSHTGAVRRIYETVLASASDMNDTPATASVTTAIVAHRLQQAGVTDVPSAVKTIDILVNGPGFGHVSQRTKDLFGHLFPTLIEQAGKAADPDGALARFEKFVNAYGSRGLLYEVLAGNPKLVEMLMRVGDNSAFLMETLTREPDLFDEICRGVVLAEPKSPTRLRDEALTLAGQAEEDTPGDAVRRWKHAELVRIGLEDILGLVDIEQLHKEMTHLATACLEAALVHAKSSGDTVTFCVIGMGKIGGQELGYGADLDVLFVGGKDASEQTAAIDMAGRVMDYMMKPTTAGSLFKVDPRLRPDGEKGVLASSIEAHRDYYRNRAMLWERQALTKARFVAGDVGLGERFMTMVREIVYARGLTSEEQREIRKMRHRIETQRGDQRQADLEFKTGPGGLMDVEFLVQALQLMHGHQHDGLRTSHTLAALNRLTALGIVDDEPGYHLRRHYLFLRRIESILRRQENTGVSRLPSSDRELTALAKRMGFASATEFRGNYDLARRLNRSVFDSFLPSS